MLTPAQKRFLKEAVQQFCVGTDKPAPTFTHTDRARSVAARLVDKGCLVRASHRSFLPTEYGRAVAAVL